MQANQEQHSQESSEAKLEALVVLKDQLKKKVDADMILLKLMGREMDIVSACDQDNQKRLQLLTSRHTQLKDLLRAHHLIGGYDVIESREGKGLCVSLATAYDGQYLETFNLDMDNTPTLSIKRDNIPPFIPLGELTKQSNAQQEDKRVFLDTLSQHLNAYAGRKHQLSLVKELHTSVEVMESNGPCTLLLLMLTLPVPQNKPSEALCTLEYGDLTRCLPTKVTIDCLPDSEQTKYCNMFLDTPVHTALSTMRTTGMIL